VVLFRERRHFVLPEAAYGADGVGALIGARGCRNPVRFSRAEIDEVTLVHPRVVSMTEGRTVRGRRGRAFAVPVTE
jgi:hypothetical protein